MGKIADAIVAWIFRHAKIKVETLKSFIDECDADADGDIYLGELWDFVKTKWYKWFKG